MGKQSRMAESGEGIAVPGCAKGSTHSGAGCHLMESSGWEAGQKGNNFFCYSQLVVSNCWYIMNVTHFFPLP